jgi:hypothetical protein
MNISVHRIAAKVPNREIIMFGHFSDRKKIGVSQAAPQRNILIIANKIKPSKETRGVFIPYCANNKSKGYFFLSLALAISSINIWCILIIFFIILKVLGSLFESYPK